MTRSPHRLREQVKDTVSELPIHAARLAVMGVGRALLLTDRVRKDYRDVRESRLGPVLGRLKNDAESLTGMVVGKVAGNGKADEEPSSAAADSEISVGKPKPAATPRPAASATRPTPPRPPATKPASKSAARPAASTATAGKPKPGPAARVKPSPASKSAAGATPEAAAKRTAKPKQTAPAESAKLPIADYDEATLASVRARLRGLDVRQVGELRDYERGHAARADFLRMYENRIAKLRDQR